MARGLTRTRAWFSGAVILYAAFLVWSLCMAGLVYPGIPIDTIFTIGLAGTALGGAVLYLRFVDPQRP